MLNTHSLDLELSSSQYASIADGSQTGLDLSGDFTVEAWIYLEQLPSTAGSSFCIASKFEAGGDQRSYRVLLLDDDKIQVYVSGDGTTSNRDYFTSTAAAVDGDDVGAWVHIAVTYDLSENEFIAYKDTSPVAGSTVNDGTVSGIYNSSAPFVVGASESGTELYFDGLIDEVRVWSDIRTPTEISDNYDTELVGDEAGLVGYWKLNNDYLDATSNDNDLTASGSPAFSETVPFPGVADITISAPTLEITATLNIPTPELMSAIEVAPPTLSVTATLPVPTLSMLNLWTNNSKNTSTFTNASKESTTWTNADKS